MKSLFGFFRQKLVEAKQQNRQQIDNLITAIESQPYTHSDMLAHLQDIKTNFLEWHIMIANQASTGLYYAQLHNKTCAARKIKTMKEFVSHKEGREMKLSQMQQTLKDLKQVEGLSGQWCNQVSQKVERLNHQIRNKRVQQGKIEEEKVELQRKRQQEIPECDSVVPVSSYCKKQEEDVEMSSQSPDERDEKNTSSRGSSSEQEEQMIEGGQFNDDRRLIKNIMGVSVSTSQQILRLERLSKIKRDRLLCHSSMAQRYRTLQVASPNRGLDSYRNAISSKEERHDLMVTDRMAPPVPDMEIESIQLSSERKLTKRRSNHRVSPVKEQNGLRITDGRQQNIKQSTKDIKTSRMSDARPSPIDRSKKIKLNRVR